jgi:small subunit ribosomal protein S3
MGQKVHPTIFRIGQTTDWKSRWFNQKKYKNYLKEDLKIRDFIISKLAKIGLERMEIERSANSIRIIIYTSRPGLIIGRGGTGIDQLREQLQKLLQQPGQKPIKQELRLEIEEIKQPESYANIIAQTIAEQIEKRIPYRRVIRQALGRIIQNKNVEGAKVMVKGRLDGAEIARKEWLSKGKIPLQTLRANIDYAWSTAYTTYGTVGVKVWIYKGEVF